MILTSVPTQPSDGRPTHARSLVSLNRARSVTAWLLPEGESMGLFLLEHRVDTDRIELSLSLLLCSDIKDLHARGAAHKVAGVLRV